MRLHLSTHLPLCLLQGQMARHTSQPRQRREREEFNHTPQSTPTYPPHPIPISKYPPTAHTHSSPTLPLSFSSFSFFHLFKSLHFRCIHTFPISLCMSLSPTLPPPPRFPLSTPSLLLLSLSLFLSLPPVLTSSNTSLLRSSFLLPYLPPFFPPSIPLL